VTTRVSFFLCGTQAIKHVLMLHFVLNVNAFDIAFNFDFALIGREGVMNYQILTVLLNSF